MHPEPSSVNVAPTMRAPSCRTLSRRLSGATPDNDGLPPAPVPPGASNKQNKHGLLTPCKPARLCSHLLEKDGGAYGCQLPAGHAGVHDLPQGKRHRRVALDARAVGKTFGSLPQLTPEIGSNALSALRSTTEYIVSNLLDECLLAARPASHSSPPRAAALPSHTEASCLPTSIDPLLLLAEQLKSPLPKLQLEAQMKTGIFASCSSGEVVAPRSLPSLLLTTSSTPIGPCSGCGKPVYQVAIGPDPAGEKLSFRFGRSPQSYSGAQKLSLAETSRPPFTPAKANLGAGVAAPPPYLEDWRGKTSVEKQEPCSNTLDSGAVSPVVTSEPIAATAKSVGQPVKLFDPPGASGAPDVSSDAPSSAISVKVSDCVAEQFATLGESGAFELGANAFVEEPPSSGHLLHHTTFPSPGLPLARCVPCLTHLQTMQHMTH